MKKIIALCKVIELNKNNENGLGKICCDDRNAIVFNDDIKD